MKLAGGEGASNFHQARNLIDHGQIGFVQIDTGRIGGIAPALKVAKYATAKGVTFVNHTFVNHTFVNHTFVNHTFVNHTFVNHTFVNHTFTTQLALAASLAPYAGIESAEICEYPVEPSQLAQLLTKDRLDVIDGQVHLNDRPGLGVSVCEESMREFLVDTEISVAGQIIAHRSCDELGPSF